MARPTGSQGAAKQSGAKPPHSSHARALDHAWAVPGSCLGRVPGPCRAAGRPAGSGRGSQACSSLAHVVRQPASPVGPIIKMFFGEICGRPGHPCAVRARMRAWRAEGRGDGRGVAAWRSTAHLLFKRRRHALPPPAVAHRDRDGTLSFRLTDDVPVQLLNDLLRPQCLLQRHLSRLIIGCCCCRLLDSDLHFRLSRGALARTHAMQG